MISVVVPVRDEERTVEPLYDELASALGGLDDSWEVVYVDDGSRDGTHRCAVRLHETTTNVRVVRMRRNAGKAAALDAGFAIVEGDFVVTIDGDLQDDPAEIPRLLAKLGEGYDLAQGGRPIAMTRSYDGRSRVCSTGSRAGSRASISTT